MFNQEDKIFIECECCSHILTVSNNIDHIQGDIYNQDFYLAMFGYGYNQKPKLWERIKIAWNYLKTGKMYEDQLVLSVDEALKLTNFIKNSINNFPKTTKS